MNRFEFIEELEKTVQADVDGKYFYPDHLTQLLDALISEKSVDPLILAIDRLSHLEILMVQLAKNTVTPGKSLASLGHDSAVGVIMTRIVEEMEDTGWQHSEFHSSLVDWRLYEAYSLAERNNLAAFTIAS